MDTAEKTQIADLKNISIDIYGEKYHNKFKPFLGT
jgi:hypothetical protein